MVLVLDYTELHWVTAARAWSGGPMAMAGGARDTPQDLLALVRKQNGEWAIARQVLDRFEWWCGERHGWVSPRSSYWEMIMRNAWEIRFSSLEAARKFAQSRGWE